MQTVINIMTIVAFAFWLWLMWDIYRRTWAKPTTKQIVKLVEENLDDDLYFMLVELMRERNHADAWWVK